MALNGKIILKGLGLHSGKDCELIIEPCDSDEILMNGVPLRKFNLVGTNRGSDYIFKDGEREIKIRTCEHVLSALTGMGIYSNAKLTVNGGEMPALDGCAKLLCDEILKNSASTSKKTTAEGLNEGFIVSSDDRKRFVAAFPCDHLHITYTVEYDFVGTQTFDYVHTPENYYENISMARTFAMLSDIEYLRSHGMALGGSLDNAIVIGEKIQASGGLHWKNEFVRHKILDLIGDLSAVGKPFNAHIIAMKAGHELHLKLVEKLRGVIN